MCVSWLLVCLHTFAGFFCSLNLLIQFWFMFTFLCSCVWKICSISVQWIGLKWFGWYCYYYYCCKSNGYFVHALARCRHTTMIQYWLQLGPKCSFSCDQAILWVSLIAVIGRLITFRLSALTQYSSFIYVDLSLSFFFSISSTKQSFAWSFVSAWYILNQCIGIQFTDLVDFYVLTYSLMGILFGFLFLFLLTLKLLLICKCIPQLFHLYCTLIIGWLREKRRNQLTFLFYWLPVLTVARNRNV